jgi:hypothetical protein
METLKVFGVRMVLNTEENNNIQEKENYAKHGLLKHHTNILIQRKRNQKWILKQTIAETQMVKLESGVTLQTLIKDLTTVTQ